MSAKLRRLMTLVHAHYGIDGAGRMVARQTARESPTHAMVCYRAIAYSLGLK